jgi:hypothetical protein
VRLVMLPLILVIAAANSSAETSSPSPDSDTGAPPGARRYVTGGGCLNEEGGTNGRQSTFGGRADAGPVGAADAHVWQHVDRNGRVILFNFKSEDARLVYCRPVPPRHCPSKVMDVRAEIEGTGRATLQGQGTPVDANFQATIVDVRDNTCGPERDTYSITVRAGLLVGGGEVLFETSGEIDCGNLQVHGFQPGPR